MIDMHIHTNNSDGQYSTYEIVEMLKKLGISLFSITDHDSIESCLEMQKIILPKNMIYIPGIEFSARYNNYNCHILGYKIDYTNDLLLKECELIRMRRHMKIIQIFKYINDNYGILTDEEKKYILQQKKTIGRSDICDLLVKKGYGDRKSVYEKFLTPKNLIIHRSDSGTIIDVIHKSNGLAVLAHPKEIEEDYNIDIEFLLKLLIDIGLDGIEVYNSIHSEEDAIRYMKLAEKYHLLTTGGSDYHGINKPKIILGTTTKKNVKIKTKDINFYTKS